jgi:membrane-bound serine protease (ClpP class)
MDSLTVAYLLIALGLILLAAELVLPTSGMLFLGSTLCLLAGVVMTFYYGDASTGAVTLLCVFVAVPVLLTLGMYYWPRTPMGRRLILPDQDATIAQMPVHLELEQLRGRYGKASSDLRPSGVVDFDGKRIDVITEGMMVAAGGWVRCVDVRAGKVVVRPSEAPNLKDLEADDFNV